VKLFGFEILRPKETDLPSFVSQTNEDGSLFVDGGGIQGSYVNLDATAKTDAELVSRYRILAQQPEVDRAIEDIVNEAIVFSEDRKIVDVVLDDVDLPDSVLKKIRDEFDVALDLLDFYNRGYDIFNRWYVDGRLNYHAIIDNKKLTDGIKELRYIDPRKIRKVKEYEKNKTDNGTIKKLKAEYYVFNEMGYHNTMSTVVSSQIHGLKIAKDSIIYTTSGLTNENNTLVLSHIHKAMKPINQLKILEDSTVIYRLARAPERRMFFVDVGTAPKMKAEQYVKDLMSRFKNKLEYDPTTGQLKDERLVMSPMEDYWLPRREGGRGTEVTTLPGGQNLGEIEDVLYFQRKVYQALNVPVSRLEAENAFSLGRSTEVTRDEVKFSRFITRLRNRFAMLFNEILERNLILKKVMQPAEWDQIKNKIRYDFKQDNHFDELKEAEIFQNRAQVANEVDQFVGRYYSNEWIRKNILQQSEDDMEEIDKQIQDEKGDEQYEPPEEDEGFDRQPPPPKPKPTPAPDAEPKDEEEEDKKPTQEEQRLMQSMTNFLDNLHENKG
jgi:hypothetical protein